MIKEPKIRGKDAGTDKTGWLHHPYTLDARAFYLKQHAEAQKALNNAAGQCADIFVARQYERLMAIEEVLALLTHNEQNRDDDD